MNPGAKKRTDEELTECVQEWIEKKFHKGSKEKMRLKLVPTAKWSYELVVNKIKFPEEIEIVQKSGIGVIYLSKIIADLERDKTIIEGASGTDFVDLVLLKKLID